MNARTALSLLTILVATQSVFAADSADKTPDGTKSATTLGVQDVVIFGPSQPIFIRLHIQVDGKPFGQYWLQLVQEVFNGIDSDQDGFLTRDETKPSPQPEDSPRSAEIATLLRLRGLWNSDLQPFDGRLTLDEFAQFLRNQNRGPFQSPPNEMSSTTAATHVP